MPTFKKILLFLYWSIHYVAKVKFVRVNLLEFIGVNHDKVLRLGLQAYLNNCNSKRKGLKMIIEE